MLTENQILKKKNLFLAIMLGITIMLRGIANCIFISINTIHVYMIGGMILVGVLFLLQKLIKNQVIVMYITIFIMSLMCIGLMALYPAKVNYILFLIAVVYSSVYERSVPVAIETTVSVLSLIIFYFKFVSNLSYPWGPDSTTILVLYVILIDISLTYQVHISKLSYKQIVAANKEKALTESHTLELLDSIKTTIATVNDSSKTINENLVNVNEISNNISSASGDVSSEALNEVQRLEKIKSLVSDGVNQINNVKNASAAMTESSIITHKVVKDSSDMAVSLSSNITDLNVTMNDISNQMNKLCDENQKILDIISTLDDITSQTNLLSLNASIEAARAGEHGKGFAVVAEQIRSLADSSNAFTSEISSILYGINEQSDVIVKKINRQQTSLNECNKHAAKLKDSFENINQNATIITNKSKQVDEDSINLSQLMNLTLTDLGSINDNVESTAASMEEISASIHELHNSITSITSEFNEINTTTDSMAQI